MSGRYVEVESFKKVLLFLEFKVIWEILLALFNEEVLEDPLLVALLEYKLLSVYRTRFNPPPRVTFPLITEVGREMLLILVVLSKVGIFTLYELAVVTVYFICDIPGSTLVNRIPFCIATYYTYELIVAGSTFFL